MRTKILIAILIQLGISNLVSAHSKDSTLIRSAQVSFFTPVGTNGMESHQYTNNISFNILAGYNGGIAGFELAGLVNTLKYDMKGCQIAGIGNTVLGNVQGAQIGGIFNVNKLKTNGLQIGGISNYAKESDYLAQISGIANVVLDTLIGVQIGGITNVSECVEGGLQIAGIANVSAGEVIGSQISAITNTSEDNLLGLQITGITNLSSGNTVGSQIAGIANTTNGNLIGCQIAGIANVCRDSLLGAQISFANYAKHVKGMQLGFINIADTFEQGVPVGFISIVNKGGYRKLELFTSETIYAGAKFKLGAPKFYNIFSIGGSQINSDYAWGFGYGIGSEVVRINKFSLNIDALATQMTYNDVWSNHLSLVNTISIYPTINIRKHLAFFIGLSFSAHVIERQYSEGVESFDKSFVPYSTVTYYSQNVLVKLYPGLTAGVRF